MGTRLEQLKTALAAELGERVVALEQALNEVTLVVRASDFLEVTTKLRDCAGLRFEQLLDLCGVDYLNHGNGTWEGPRFAVVLHLLSISHNWRLRVRTFLEDESFPTIDSLTEIWPNANWYEREAFDLYGIVFVGHSDLRRILTDYGFVGHPFRKDFPVTGNVEMRYDPEQGRVIYQPITIEPREIVPRIVREDKYGGLGPRPMEARKPEGKPG
jgi:NADH-quinone oxidoreductase subunit C